MSKAKLEDLSDEVLLHIFCFLQIPDLLRCSQISKRFRSISHDESLWQKINLYKKKVPPTFLQRVINNGCKYLCLVNASLEDGKISLQKNSQLKYLELTNFRANPHILQDIFASCHSLEKMSFSSYDVPYDSYHSLNSNMLTSICLQNGQSIKVLDLTWCSELDFQSIKLIVDHCEELTEFNLEYTNLSENSISYLFNNLTTNIIKLSLAGLENVKENVEILANRCKKLTTLDLRSTMTSNNGFRIIAENLFSTSEEVDITDTDITIDILSNELKKMTKLKVLNVGGHPDSIGDIVNRLKKDIPHVRINEQEYIKIAESCQSFQSEHGFWEIETKQLQMFSKNNGSEIRSYHGGGLRELQMFQQSLYECFNNL